MKLHQAAVSYGVGSVPLGSERIDESGWNAGHYELASGVEVLAHLQRAMSLFVQTGRVHFFPMTEYLGEGQIRSLVSGEIRTITTRTVVDGTVLETSIPALHRPSFAVDDGVQCVPPNQLPHAIADQDRVVVLGGGKTSMDTALWLLDNDFPADRITWVRPRDAWLFNRRMVQPGAAFVEPMLRATIDRNQSTARAETLEQVADGYEAASFWLRLDPNTRPSMFHAAVVTEAEVSALRTITNVVRLGRVRRVTNHGVQCANGEHTERGAVLYVDCTASGLRNAAQDRTPIFQPGHIRLQMIRTFQPTFSAALIGFIEASVSETDRNGLAAPTPMTDSLNEWAGVNLIGARNEAAWLRNRDVRAWLASNRLNVGAAVMNINPHDTVLIDLLDQVRESAPAAHAALQRLALT